MTAIADAARCSNDYASALRQRAREYSSKPSCEFSHPSLCDVVWPDARSAGAAAAAAAPRGGGGGGGGGGGAAAHAHASSPPTAPAGATSADLLILYDWENAHKALAPLRTRAASSAGRWRLLVFSRLSSALEAGAGAEIVRAATDAPEAADTRLCFTAGVEHERLPPSVPFLVVCGSEGRYAELVATLAASGRRAKLLRLDSARPGDFEADLVRTAATLGCTI